MLEAQGVSFANGKADSIRRLTSDDVSALVAEES